MKDELIRTRFWVHLFNSKLLSSEVDGHIFYNLWYPLQGVMLRISTKLVNNVEG